MPIRLDTRPTPGTKLPGAASADAGLDRGLRGPSLGGVGEGVWLDPSLAPPDDGDSADIEQLDDGQHGPHRNRDHRAFGEASAGQRDLDRPGEGGVADAEAGRG